MKVGIIGFGRMGKLITKYLAQDTDLYVTDIEDRTSEIKSLGATPADLETVCSCPIVIPMVPISSFESVIKSIAPLLAKDTLLVDVCSVKTHPANLMKEHLPESVHILATHPMFGPDSAKNTLFGSKIVLCQVRTPEPLYKNIKSYLEGHGLKVIESTPEEHDRQIASSLMITHFVGRTLIDFKANNLEIDTKGYRRLMKILETVENDTWQLFEDMNKYNPYAEKIRKSFLESMQKIDERLYQ